MYKRLLGNNKRKQKKTTVSNFRALFLTKFQAPFIKIEHYLSNFLPQKKLTEKNSRKRYCDRGQK